MATGTFYAPASDYLITGNGSQTILNAQLIGYTFKVTGNGDVIVNYDSNLLFQMSGIPTIRLAE